MKNIKKPLRTKPSHPSIRSDSELTLYRVVAQNRCVKTLVCSQAHWVLGIE